MSPVQEMHIRILRAVTVIRCHKKKLFQARGMKNNSNNNNKKENCQFLFYIPSSFFLLRE